jgi:hypothetical protein
MQNEESLKESKLFSKKVKNIKNKPLNLIISDTGMTKHFTPASQEWLNSIYTYNNNYLKSLSIADNNIINLIKVYLNSYINNNHLTGTNKINKEMKRKSTKRVYVGKGEFKHTNSKIVMTFFLYNTEEFYINGLYRKERKFLFCPEKNLSFTDIKEINDKKQVIRNRRFTLVEFLSSSTQRIIYRNYYEKKISKINEWLVWYFKFLKKINKLVKNNILTKKDLYLWRINKINKFCNISNIVPLFMIPTYSSNYHLWWGTMRDIYIKKLREYLYFKQINNIKMHESIISKFINLISNLYNKDIKLNLINLRKMHLNSDIYTQVVSLKLRNKKSRLYKVLKKSLRKVKLSQMSIIAEKLAKPEKNEFIINNIRNNIISSMFNNNNKDPLTNLVLNFFPIVNRITLRRKFKRNPYISHKFINYVIKHLKNKKLRGIRVEAKGRISRRFVAARSVFKMRWRGGLKNVISSFRGLPTTMLRGIYKSNVQYSFTSSKNRNGAFGIKGWISSK